MYSEALKAAHGQYGMDHSAISTLVCAEGILAAHECNNV